MKKLLTLLMVTLCMLSIHNQSFAQLSVGATGGAAILSVEGESITFPGGTLTLRYGIGENIRVGANLGYFVKSVNEGDLDISGSISGVPITGTFEYSFGGESFSPYAGLDLGLYRLGVSIGGDGTNLTISDSYFGLAPTLGVMYNLSDNLALNANAKYHYVLVEDEAQSLIGIGAGIVFKF
ncbi:MAG: outer membrane beta-barrel protein [Bacteroidota bacterium]